MSESKSPSNIIRPKVGTWSFGTGRQTPKALQFRGYLSNVIPIHWHRGTLSFVMKQAR